MGAPFGLVDNDSADLERLAELQSRGVLPLNVYSVESIYYHPEAKGGYLHKKKMFVFIEIYLIHVDFFKKI